MQKYRSHKIVEALDLSRKHVTLIANDGGSVTITFEGEMTVIPANRINHLTTAEIEDGYLVKYPDGYVSWSPRKPFEEGYAAIPPDA